MLWGHNDEVSRWVATWPSPAYSAAGTQLVNLLIEGVVHQLLLFEDLNCGHYQLDLSPAGVEVLAVVGALMCRQA